jgi:hypothetical protein
MTKIFVGHPSGGSINPYTHNSLSYNLWELGKAGVVVSPPRTYDEYPLSLARIEMVNDFLESDCTHLFTYDDDQVFTRGVILRLLEANKDIVSGWYLGRKGDLGITVFGRGKGKRLMDISDFNLYRPLSLREFYMRKQPDSPLIEVEGIGMGVVLISRDALENMQKLCDRMELPMFLEWSPLMEPDYHKFGEDLWFSDVAAKAGIPLYVHLGCFVGHWAKQGFVIGHQHLQKRMMKEGILEVEMDDLVS